MKGTVRGSTAFDIDGYFLEIRNGYNMFFTPRAVLRIGMLLRDRCLHVSLSHVAPRVSRGTKGNRYTTYPNTNILMIKSRGDNGKERRVSHRACEIV